MILAASTMCCVSCEDWSWSWVWARVASNEFGAASYSFQIYQGLLCKVGDVLCFLLMQAPSFKKNFNLVTPLGSWTWENSTLAH
jgi:hypothetical protein